MDDDFDEDIEFQSVSNKDRLDFRQTIRRFMESLLNAKDPGTIEYRAKVLKKALCFDIPGLPFKTKMNKFTEEVKKEIKEYKEDLFVFLGNRGSIYYNPKKREDLLFQDKPTYKHSMTNYEWGELWTPFLIGLLAEIEALFKTKGAIDKRTELGEKMKELDDIFKNKFS